MHILKSRISRDVIQPPDCHAARTFQTCSVAPLGMKPLKGSCRGLSGTARTGVKSYSIPRHDTSRRRHPSGSRSPDQGPPHQGAPPRRSQGGGAVSRAQLTRSAVPDTGRSGAGVGQVCKWACTGLRRGSLDAVARGQVRISHSCGGRQARTNSVQGAEYWRPRWR